MTDNTDASSLSVDVALRTYVSNDEGDNESYCMELSGTILAFDHDDDESREVGTISLFLCRLGEAETDKVSCFDVLDSLTETAPYQELFDDQGHWSDEVQKLCHTAGESDLLVIHRVEVEPEYRGNWFGLLAVRACIRMFGAGCGLVAMKPFPLLYEGNVTAENREAFRRDRKKLTRHWCRLGFKRFGDLLIMDTASRRPTLEKILRGRRTEKVGRA